MTRYLTTSPLIAPLLRRDVVERAEAIAAEAELDDLERAKREFFERGGRIRVLTPQKDRDVEPDLLPF